MPPKKKSAAELLEIIKEGGSVLSKENRSEEVLNVVEELRKLITIQQSQMAEQQATMNKLIADLTQAIKNFKGGEVDLKPLETLIDKLVAVSVIEKPAYRFDVERNSRGFITTMTAKPSTPTIN